MKKIVSAILVCVLLVGTVFTLASCNMVMGTYAAGNTELEFGMGKVTITEKVTNPLTGDVTKLTYECKYKIEEDDDGKTITFTYEEGADEHYYLNGTKTFSEIDDGTKYIQIGTVGKYEKQ